MYIYLADFANFICSYALYYVYIMYVSIHYSYMIYVTYEISRNWIGRLGDMHS